MATIAELKAKLAEAMTLNRKLTARAALAQRAGLSQQYNGVLGTFSKIAARVQAALGAGSFTDAVKALWNGPGTAGLGIAPLVLLTPLAAGGLITLIVSWTTDAYALDRRLDAYEAEIARGTPPDQAAKNIAKVTGDGEGGPKGSGSVLGDIGTLLKWGAVIATAAIAGPPIVRALEQRKGSK